MALGILGVTGGTGLSLLDQALTRGHEVVAVARRPERLGRSHPRLAVARGDVRSPDSLATPLAGCDAVVSCVGVSGLLAAREGTDLYSVGARSVGAALRAAGRGRLIVVSSGGVEPQPSDGWVYRKILRPFFLEPIYADMRVMEAELRQSALAWTIVLPGLRRRPVHGGPEPRAREPRPLLAGRGRGGAVLARGLDRVARRARACDELFRAAAGAGARPRPARLTGPGAAALLPPDVDRG